ncbi:MAG: TolC family outer membrane protein [Maricaulaceae bacterium]
MGRGVILGVWLCVCAPIAVGQTLFDALALTYGSNPTLLSQRAQLRETQDNITIAQALRFPTLGISGQSRINRFGSNNFGQDGGGVSRGFSAGINANQSVFQGGFRRAQIAQAKASTRAGVATLRSVEQEVMVSVVDAYATVLLNEEILDIRLNNRKVLDRQLQAARDRFEVGEITRTDVAQAEARLAAAMSDLADARAILANARAAYAAVVGEFPGTLADVPPHPELPASLEDAQGAAIVNNPDLDAQRHIETAARQGIKIARSALRPTFDINSGGARSRSLGFPGQISNSANLGANVNVPLLSLPDNVRTRQARQSASRARIDIAVVRRQVEQRVALAWNNLLAARAVAESSVEQIRAAQVAFEGVEQEAFVGLRTTLEVLDSEQELLNAQLTKVTADRDLYLAAFELLAAVGAADAESLSVDVTLYDPDAYLRDTRWKFFKTSIDE